MVEPYRLAAIRVDDGFQLVANFEFALLDAAEMYVHRVNFLRVVNTKQFAAFRQDASVTELSPALGVELRG